MINYSALIKKLGVESARLSTSASDICLSDVIKAKQIWTQQDVIVTRIAALIKRQNREENINYINLNWSTERK